MSEATEAAQRKAEELGVDIASVEGTGSGGNVTVSDVEAKATEPTQPVRVAVNPALEAQSYTTGDGDTYYRDTPREVSQEKYEDLRKIRIGGRQAIVKEDSR